VINSQIWHGLVTLISNSQQKRWDTHDLL